MRKHQIKITVGVGQGLYVGGNLFDVVGIGGGMYGDYLSVRYKDGQWIWGQDVNTEFVISVFPAEYGFQRSQFRPIGPDQEWEYDNWTYLNKDKDTITFDGAAYFLFIGGSFSVDFDLNSFLADMDRLFHN